jgi:hypothetical protein
MLHLLECGPPRYAADPAAFASAESAACVSFWVPLKKALCDVNGGGGMKSKSAGKVRFA